MKNTFFFIMMLFTCSSLQAQGQSSNLDLQFFQAYAMNSLPLWEDGIRKLTESSKELTEATQKIPLAKACYAAATNYMVKDEKKKALALLDQSEEILDAVLESQPKSPEAHALKSGVMGMRIALSPMKGMTLGGKSARHISEAYEYDPMSPLVNLLKGNYLFYTPSMWGGDMKEAVKHLSEAKKMYELKNEKMKWEYLTTLALLGQAYHKEGKLEDAKTTYDAALAVAPTFGWVKMVLKPQLEKDIK